MAQGERDITIPPDWPDNVRSALIGVAELAHRTITYTRSWCVNAEIPRVRLAAKAERAENRVSLVEEIMAIKDARLVRVDPRERPRYSPTERLRILELKAACGWNQAETARIFLVTPETIASWVKRVGERGPNALLQIPQPVNRYPEFVALVVQRLKVHCPLLGKKRMAKILARCALHLSTSTVGRMVKGWTPPRNDVGTSGDQSKPELPIRKIVARCPDHTWHVDLTAVPVRGGFWTWFPPFTLPQRMPHGYYVAVAVDHFSRLAKGFAIFLGKPSSEQVCTFLDALIEKTGKPPKYIISDQGLQFRDEYKAWCADERRKIKPRFGKVGEHGSIAVVERFIKSMKDECTRRILVPDAVEDFQHELGLYFSWYNQFRPHEHLGGCTPVEIYESTECPANTMPRIEPRLRWPADSKCARPQAPVRGDPGDKFELVIAFLEGRKHLPIIELRDVA